MSNGNLEYCWHGGKKYELDYDEFGSSPRHGRLVQDTTKEIDYDDDDDDDNDDDYYYEQKQQVEKEKQNALTAKTKQKRVAAFEDILAKMDEVKNDISDMDNRSLLNDVSGKEIIHNRARVVTEMINDLTIALKPLLEEMKASDNGVCSNSPKIRKCSRHIYASSKLNDILRIFYQFAYGTISEYEVEYHSSEIISQMNDIREGFVYFCEDIAS